MGSLESVAVVNDPRTTLSPLRLMSSRTLSGIAVARDVGQAVLGDAVEHEHLGLALNDVTIGTSTCCSAFVSVLKLDGSTLKSVSAFGTNGTTLNLPELTATGTYTIVIDPQGTATGSVTLTLSEHVTNSITIGTRLRCK